MKNRDGDDETHDMTPGLNAVRDQLLALVRDHEEEHHGGRPCRQARVVSAAYLAHCLGVEGFDDLLDMNILVNDFAAARANRARESE